MERISKISSSYNYTFIALVNNAGKSRTGSFGVYQNDKFAFR